MIINKLELTSFGKFQNKQISFDDEMNILEGNNEVGKTTIHKFIEGMLFGFLDPTKARRAYTQDHAKYQPKNASDYRGSMLFTLDKKQYRIERNFDKKQLSVALYNEKDGENITEKLIVHQSTKLPDISEFIGISYKLYLNTVSISQLLRNTEKDLGKALIERLHNITTTKDESISIQVVHDELDKSLAEIGSAKAKTKPYAKAIERVKEIEDMIDVSEKKYLESERLFKDKNHKKQEVLTIGETLKKINNDIHQYYNTKKKEQYDKAKQIKNGIQQNETKITTNKELLSLEEEEYERLNQIKADLKHAQEKKLEHVDKEKTLNKTIEETKEFLSENPSFSTYNKPLSQFRDLFYTIDKTKSDVSEKNKELESLTLKINKTKVDHQVIEDHQRVEKLKEKKEEIDTGSLNQKSLELSQEITNLRNKKDSKFLVVIYYILYIVVIGIFLQKKRKRKESEIQEQIELKKEELNTIKETLEETNEALQEYTRSIHEILEKYNLSQIYDLSEMRRTEDSKKQTLDSYYTQKNLLEIEIKKLQAKLENEQLDFTKQCAILNIKEITNKEALDQFEEKFHLHQQTKRKNEELTESYHQNEKLIKQLNEMISSQTKRYQEILAKNNLETAEQFKAALKTKQEMLQLQHENEQLSKRMFDLTDGKALDEFEKNIDFNLDDYKKNKTLKELEEEQILMRKNLRLVESEAYELEKEISLIEKTYTDVYTLKAMLNKAKNEMTEIKSNKEAIELAGHVIDELAKEIQYEFAPSLNEAISEVMNTITNGKYKELKIDPDTNIKVVDEYLKQLLETNDYSTGTIDQIYFSMRLGLTKILFDHPFPYILDDTFVNYDETRLKLVLKLLSNEERQVILFTCHKREHNLAIKENIDHYHSTLS